MSWAYQPQLAAAAQQQSGGGSISVSAGAGDFALTAGDILPGVLRRLTAATGLVSTDDPEAGFVRGYGLPAGTAIYAAGGQSAAFDGMRAVGVVPASFDLAGGPAGLLCERLQDAEGGAVTLSAGDAAARVARHLAAEYGAFQRSGNPVALSGEVVPGGGPASLALAISAGL